ncbi:hypothetical protein AHF37_11464 [Paragonimus kellicotti]|nr:hypothetical protein AHF37_11464 [Paragonimus kellicotti]
MTIEEEQPVDIPLGQIFAVDADTHGNGRIVFFLAEVSPVIYKQFGTEQFMNNDGIPTIVISKHGVLWSKQKLDREKTPLIDVLVGAHDLGEPRLTTYTSLRIILKDINDHAPIWQFPTKTDFLVKVLKSGISVNSTITRIRAIDFDLQQNARLSYGLMAPSNESANTDSDISLACYISQKFLAVHSQSGEIKMINSLSKLPTGFMDVWLVVTDHGATPRQSISKLVLYLADSSSQLSETQLPLSYQHPSNWLVTKIRAIKSTNVLDVLDSLTGTSGRGTHLQHNGSLPMFIGAAASSFLLLFFIVCTVLLLGIRRRTMKRVKEKHTECSQNVVKGPNEESPLGEDSLIISDSKPNTLRSLAFNNGQRSCDDWMEGGTLKSLVLDRRDFSVVSENSSTNEIIDRSCTENRLGKIVKPYSMMNNNDSLSTAYATSTSAFDLSTSTIPLSIVTISPEIYPVSACVTDMETVHSEMLKFSDFFTSVIPVCRVPPDFIPSDHCEKRRNDNSSVFNVKPFLFTQNMNKTKCVVSLNVPLQSIAKSQEND